MKNDEDDIEKLAREAAERAIELARQRGEKPKAPELDLSKIQGLFQDAKCPLRQALSRSLRREGKWGAAFASIRQQIGSGFLIALVGAWGNGKTQIGVELIRAATHQMKTARFCTTAELLIEFKHGYSKEVSEKDVIAMFRQPSLLVLDEFGKRRESEWENLLLFELLNRRYNDMKDTLIISNQTKAEAEAALGPSIVSRMRETGGFIECDWESFRK